VHVALLINLDASRRDMLISGSRVTSPIEVVALESW
jgi:hypothetical protein